MNKVCVIIVFLVSGFLKAAAQQLDYDKKIKVIDSLTAAYLPDQALDIIDAALAMKPPDKRQEMSLRIKRLVLVVQSENYDQAIALSIRILKKFSPTKEEEIKIRIQRALCFEILGQFDSCKKELEQIASYYKVLPKNTKEYAVFLYRYSSYYRMLGDFEQARKYALHASNFSQKNGFESEYAVSSMLLGFMEEDYKKRILYLDRSLDVWLKVGDVHGASAMYIAKSKIWLKKDNLLLAKEFAQRALQLIEKTSIYSSKSMAYYQLSAVYEKTQQLDSALYYYKLFNDTEDKNVLMLQNVSVHVKEMQFENEKKELLLQSLQKEYDKSKKLNIQLAVSISLIALFLFATVFLMFRVHKKNQKIKIHEIDLLKKNKKLKSNINQKKILLKELHHRTKNNLALVSSFIDYQFKGKFSFTMQDIASVKNRINSLALAHQVILNQFEDKGTAEEYCNLNDYLKLIVNTLIESDFRTIDCDFHVADIIIDCKTAIPLGIILNELLSNTLLHAETEDSNLRITIEVQEEIDGISLSYRDSGKKNEAIEVQKSTGSKIIENMVRQLKGRIENTNFDYNIFVKIKK